MLKMLVSMGTCLDSEAKSLRRERGGSLKFIFGGRKQALSPQWRDSARFSNITTVFKSSPAYKHNIYCTVYTVKHILFNSREEKTLKEIAEEVNKWMSS